MTENEQGIFFVEVIMMQNNKKFDSYECNTLIVASKFSSLLVNK